MIKHNQDGAISGVGLSLIITSVFLVFALGFGGWAFMSRQDYKNHSDAKSAIAAEAARKVEDAKNTVKFNEDVKNPVKTYNGPEAYGSLHVEYPKTWSGYVDASGEGNAQLDGYFAPGVVPATGDKNSVFALRTEVVDESYSQTLESFASQQQSGKITVTAYALPKLPKVTGVLVSGVLDDQAAVTMVVLPLRSQTLKIWTEGSQYLPDFNKYILPEFSFSP